MKSKILLFLKRALVRLLIFLMKFLVGLKNFLIFFAGAIARPFKWFGNAALFSFVLKIYRVYIFVKIKLGKYYLPVKNKFIYPLTRRYVTHTVLVVISFFAIAANIEAREASLETSEYIGQKSILFSLNRGEGEYYEDFVVEEMVYSEGEKVLNYLNQELGVVSSNRGTGQDLALLPIDPNNGILLNKNIPSRGEGEKRKEVIEYAVEPGDTIGAIAEKFNLNVVTLLWANKLTSRSLIRPGDKLTILPIDGVLHTVKSRDTISAIAKYYDTESDEIISFNALADAGDINIGETLIVPEGVMPRAVAPAPRPVSRLASSREVLKIPSGSPSTSGSRLVWPTPGRVITQYYTWRHAGLDVDGNLTSPIYASEAGTVEYAGWGTGYGLYITISHGNGMKTRYAHFSKLFVKTGDRVARGETIGMMGSTGWSTGSHLHFEVIINGRKQNPLNYL